MAEPPLDEVISLELRLLDPETRRDPGELDRLLHQDFTEIGASGKRWDRAATIASLTAEPGPAPEVRDIAAWRLDEGVVLVTYVATQGGDGGASSLRSSLWLRSADGWRVRFHQGTPVAASMVRTHALSDSLTAPTETECPGCGLVLPARPGAPKHPYIGASAECWALYGEVLAREYEDPAYFRVHQITVDTYAVQHPGAPERRSIQSVALHLITLCLVLEQGADPTAGPKLHARLAKRPGFQWLEPPQPNGRLTIADVHGAESAGEHERRVRAWAEDVWAAWRPHHPTVRDWIERSLRAG